MDKFRKIGLIGRLGSKKVVDTLKNMISFLSAQGFHIILDSRIADLMPGHGLQTCKKKVMGDLCDLVIVVGGDGSLLGAARALARSDVPVLGVNRGQLGFLTDISPNQFEEKFTEILAGKYSQEDRFLLKVQVSRNGKVIGEADALNDMVLHPGKATKMIEFDLFVGDDYVYNQRSDGLIVATPTGSTAYSLSGGGPIMHPKLDALVLVPMFPHTLSSRPIVVDGNSELKIIISEENETYPLVSCDGQVSINLAPGDVIKLNKHQHKLQLLHPEGYNFYRTCREKLGWSAGLTARNLSSQS
ncbi:MAG: NAD(+) kinase [Pseudomonadales bacterium]|nr:NAD(+) kinase [Pseudomonadales bacterium]NRA14453.1 NAD(+) kinase [Oceanospirillaceae bacterium]